MRKQWKRFKAWWMPIAEVIGNFMNRLVLSAFYFVIVLPFGLGVRLFSDPDQIFLVNVVLEKSTDLEAM